MLQTLGVLSMGILHGYFGLRCFGVFAVEMLQLLCFPQTTDEPISNSLMISILVHLLFLQKKTNRSDFEIKILEY